MRKITELLIFLVLFDRSGSINDQLCLMLINNISSTKKKIAGNEDETKEVGCTEA